MDSRTQSVSPLKPSTLIGSEFSPFVRRIRLFCELNHIFYFWHPVTNILEKEIPEVSDTNPAKQIPIWITEHDGPVWDSRVIAQFLSEKNKLPWLNWNEEKILATIDNLNDTAITIFVSEKAQINTHDSKHFIFARYRERIQNLLKFLDDQRAEPTLQKWNFVSISLFCCLDWLQFRNITPLEKFQNLNDFLNHHSQHSGVSDTDPRKFS